MRWAGLLLLALSSLSVAGAATSAETGCCREPPVSDFAPQSGDGSQIAFVRSVHNGTSAIFTVAAAGGAPRQLVDIGYDFFTFGAKPRLSPDWTKLALVKGTSRLKIANSDGSDPWGDPEKGFGGRSRDEVACGRRHDIAFVDPRDIVAKDCEIIRRAAQ